MRTKYFYKKGYTLLEALIVMVIISILFIFLTSRIDFSTTASKKEVVRADMLRYEDAIKAVGTQHWGLTDDLGVLIQQLNSNLDTDHSASLFESAIVSAASDPWGSQYKLIYKKPENTLGQITIVCAGPDRKYDNEGDILTELKYDTASGSVVLFINGVAVSDTGGGNADSDAHRS